MRLIQFNLKVLIRKKYQLNFDGFPFNPLILTLTLCLVFFPPHSQGVQGDPDRERQGHRRIRGTNGQAAKHPERLPAPAVLQGR